MVKTFLLLSLVALSVPVILADVSLEEVALQQGGARACAERTPTKDECNLLSNQSTVKWIPPILMEEYQSQVPSGCIYAGSPKQPTWNPQTNTLPCGDTSTQSVKCICLLTPTPGVNITDMTRQDNRASCPRSPTMSECYSLQFQSAYVRSYKYEKVLPILTEPRITPGCFWHGNDENGYPSWNSQTTSPDAPCQIEGLSGADSSAGCVCLPPHSPSPPSLPPSPPPFPALPPPVAGAVSYKVTTSFTLTGSVADYAEAQQTSIIEVLAREARVSPAAVNLTITAGSVIVTAEINVASQAEADEKSTALASGVLLNATNLQTALKAQFTLDNTPGAVSLQVESLTAPEVIGGGSGLSTGAVIGIAVGAAVVGLGILLGGALFLWKLKSGGVLTMTKVPPPPVPGSDRYTDPAPLPEGWQEMKDDKTGRAYFYNSKTGESASVRPVGDKV